MLHRKSLFLACLGLLIQGFPSHAVMLGGVNVPKEKIIVYLLIGHSNMAGVDSRRIDAVTHPQAWHYPLDTKQWVQAKESANKGLSLYGSGGPGMPFLKAMAAAYPGYYFGVVNNASLSSTCRGINTGNNGSPWDASDNRYWDSTYLYLEMLTAAKALQGEATLGGMLCMLGTVEATRTNNAVCSAFSGDIAALAGFYRRDLNMPNLPFLMGEYETGSTGDFAVTKPLPAIVLAQSRLVPSKLTTSALVSSQGIQMLDDHHYTADAGQKEWAKRAVALLQANNWVPGVSASISKIVPLNRAGTGSAWFLAESGMMTLFSDGSEYRIDGTAYRPAAAKARKPAVQAIRE